MALELRCGGCGAMFTDLGLPPHEPSLAAGECWQRYSDLTVYTLSRDASSFIHQTAVDAYGAQHAGAGTKPIAAYFTLMGLYLHLERGYSGRDVQRVHVHVGRTKSDWPTFARSGFVGALTVRDVLEASAGGDRDAALEAWAGSVWAAWSSEHARVREHTDRALAGFHRPQSGGRPTT